MLFGKYCLLERVSVGGMAEIFRAKPFNAPESQKHLALKRILPHLAEDDEFVQMFIDEAKLTVQLIHRNIVRTYELGRFHTSPYILMEFISGQDILELQRRLREERRIMSVAMCCYIAREIATGLDYVHSKTDDNGDPLNSIHR
ncbi:MAG: serine/threonine protein kinase, partial [Phycisphaerales bacterium]